METRSESSSLVEIRCDKLKTKQYYSTIVIVYGLNEDDSASENHKFWQDLSTVVKEAKGKIYVVGDFNARVVKELLETLGEDSRNNNRKRLLKFCLLQNITIANILFQHNINSFTKEMSNRRKNSVIGFILVERRDINEIIRC